jgi:signal transduction histidine kinase
METGAFAERPGLAVRYALEQRALLASRLRTACWLAVLLIPAFAALDVVLFPHLLATFIRLRIVMTALALATVLALRTATGRRAVTPLSFLMAWQAGFGIVVMTAMVGGGSSPYYAGVSLVILAVAVLMPWETSLSIAFTVSLVGAYVLVCLAWGGVGDVTTFTANIFFLCSTGVIAIVSHHAGARARRREFLQRVALEEVGRHRDEFLANITHELRTPLAAILGFAEMLDELTGDQPEEQRGWLKRIRENAATLYRLIVQLLDFSKIEAGALQLERARVDLAAIVTKVAANMRAIAGDGGAEVRVHVARDAPQVVGDPARVEEIVTNLAANALKFSEGRPIMLALRHGAVQCEPAWQRIVPDPGPDAVAGAWAEIAVTDRGRGIAHEDLHRLFIAFQQLDGSTTRRQGGTGLGLAISARLAAAMRGHVTVRSTPGAGSTFGLLLPATLPSTDEADPSGSRDATDGAGGTADARAASPA